MIPAEVEFLAATGQAATCYFRSAAAGSGRKALLQITERCNLHCAHCFVSATRHGEDMTLEQIREDIAPRLVRARVQRVTVTGGEPFVHPQIIGICEVLSDAGLAVGICTNGTCTTDEQVDALRQIPGVHINVSFDGFKAESHGRFRGSPASFDVTLETTRRFAKAGLLQGILSTPNALTEASEYGELARFAASIGAKYLLMNPLSSFGRGVKSKKRLAAHEGLMEEIRAAADEVSRGKLELVPIRFPNTEALPLAPCVAGDIIYVFVDGAVAVCPYLVFAARTSASRYADTDFMVGNILREEIAGPLDAYRLEDRYEASDPTCASCSLSSRCGKGCPAAVVAAGGALGERDAEPCPV